MEIKVNAICVKNLTVYVSDTRNIKLRITIFGLNVLRKNALVDHWCRKNHLNQLQKNCKIYLGCVKITNGVAVKSKWMWTTLKLTMESVFFGKSFVQTLLVKLLDSILKVYCIGEKKSVSRKFLIIWTLHYAPREGVMHLFDQNWWFCLIFWAKWDGLDLTRCQTPPKNFFDPQGGQGGQ